MPGLPAGAVHSTVRKPGSGGTAATGPTSESPVHDQAATAASSMACAQPPELDRLEGPDYLPALLESSDYVALTAPETPETDRLLGAAELARMRPGAVFINLSRGTLVDEAALVRALEARRLRGAMLDVFETEPLPADHPLWGLENVLVTPHVGGTSANFWKRETELIVRNISRYQRGEPLENRVDKARGY